MDAFPPTSNSPGLQMIEESDFEAVISQYEEEPTDLSSTEQLAHILAELKNGGFDLAGEQWKSMDFAPFPGEDWEGAYTWLRKVAIYREEVTDAKLTTAKQTITELQRTIAAKQKNVSELQGENRLLRSLTTRSSPKSAKDTSESLILKSQIANLTSGIASRDLEIAELSHKLDLATSEIQRVSILSAHFRTQMSGFPSNSNSIETSEDVIRLLREVQELKEEKRDMKKQLDDCERLRDIIKEREKTIEDMTSRDRRIESEGNATAEVKSMQKYLKDVEIQHLEEIENIRNALFTEKQLREAAETRSRAFESYQSQSKDLKNYIERLQTDVQTHQSTSEDMQSSNSILISQNSELQSRLIVVEQRANRCQSMLDKAEKQQSELESAYNDAKSTAFSQEQTIKRMTEVTEELRQEIERLREEGGRYDEDLERLRSELEASAARNEELEREVHRLEAFLDPETGETRIKPWTERESQLNSDLKSSLDENEMLYKRLKDAETNKQQMDEISTELEILKQEHSVCIEESRSQFLSSQHASSAFSTKVKEMSEKLESATSEIALLQANLRLKEEEIVHLNSLIEQYKRQVQDCRDMLHGQLPHSKTARAYAEGMAQDWDLIGKIAEQLRDIDELREKVAALEGENENLMEEIEHVKKENKEIGEENEAVREENQKVVEKAATAKIHYKERLSEFQQALEEQQYSLRKSYEELGRKSTEFQEEIHRYAQQREHDLQLALDRERELQLTFQRDSEQDSINIQYSEEIRKLHEVTRKSITSVSQLADSIGRMFEDWRQTLPKTIIPVVKSQRIMSNGEISSDLNTIKGFVSTLLIDFTQVSVTKTEERRAKMSADYESTLDFAQRLLQRFDMEGGHVEDALVVQLIKEKLGLERELLKKSEQLLKDERFFRRTDGLKNEESRQNWATARWQESESETYRLRTLFMENSKRLEDFFMEKGINNSDSGTISELRSQIKLLRRENQAKDTTIKSLEINKSVSDSPPSKSMISQKSSYEGLISDMRSQQTQLKATFESREKAWKDAIISLRDSLQSHFSLDESTLAKMDFTASPGSFVSILVTAILAAKKRNAEDSTEQNRQLAQLKAEIDSWTVKEESWSNEKTAMQKALDRSRAENDRLKTESGKMKELVEQLMKEIKEITRRAETEIPAEHFKRGIAEGELKGKKEQKRLKMVVADYRDQLDAMRVKFEGLQDQIVSLTGHNNQLIMEKETLHEEVRSQMDIKSRSRIMKRSVLLSRQVSTVKPEEQEMEFEPPRPQVDLVSQNSLQLSISRDLSGAKQKTPIFIDKDPSQPAS